MRRITFSMRIPNYESQTIKQMKIEKSVAIIIVGENFTRILVNIVVHGKLQQVIIARLDGFSSILFLFSLSILNAFVLL